jgi:hypothetical protein
VQSTPQQLELSATLCDRIAWPEDGAEIEWGGIDSGIVEIIARNKLVRVDRVMVMPCMIVV